MPFQTTRDLLKHYVKTLHLKGNAAYPREQAESKDFIRRYRLAQQREALHDARYDADGVECDCPDRDCACSIGR